VETDTSLMRICRLLCGGEVIALAADGAFAKDFVDVPFLGGKLRLPCGWARLAAATGSNVLIFADTQIDRRRRKVWLFDHVCVRGDSTEEIYRAVSQAARVLEELVRREPWSWHPWQRLAFRTADDGSLRMSITGLGAAKQMAAPVAPDP
jgi:lauroyl/myristoyl acyltransferase